MKTNSKCLLVAIVLLTWATAESAQAQPPGMRGGRGGGPPTPHNMPNETVSPVPVGEPGVAWYSTWAIAKAEAIRSNRPILYMAATTQCGGVPGVF